MAETKQLSMPLGVGVLVHCYDLNSHINDFEARHINEYLIKFLVMNDKKPLILDYKTFVESTKLDYAKDTYVSHPSPRAVKAELAKIVENPILLDRTHDPSKVTLIELTAFMVAVNNHENSVTPLPFTIKKKKGKSQTPTEDSEQSYSVSSGTVLDPQDPERNIQLAGTELPSTLDEGTRKLQLFPEGKKFDPKDSVGNIQPIDTGLPSTVSDEGATKTTPLPEGPRGDKDSGGLKPPADMEPQTNPVVDPSWTDAKYQADQTQSSRLSDDEDVLKAGEDMDEDTQADEEEHQSPPNTDKPEPSPAQET
ncbi:hypothetical protein Tco_1506128 [Tanacetum coccineum]